MHLILPSCRAQLTAEDWSFIRSTLLPKSKETSDPDDLIYDEEMRDTLLDQKELIQAILDETAHLTISANLYFYVLVRYVFQKFGLDCREAADYAASLLVKYLKTRHAFEENASARGPVFYVFDVLNQIEGATSDERFYLSLHLANQSLFATGLFPDSIRTREQRRAAPGISYYESVGSSYYRMAGEHRLAGEFELEGVLNNLSGCFTEARQALNELGTNLTFMGDDTSRYDLN